MGDLLYGIHPVTEALKARRREIKRVVVSGRRRETDIREMVHLAQTLHVPVHYEDDRYFGLQLAHVVHQGVAAEVSALPLYDEGAILKRALGSGMPALICALDGVEDPQNLGAIVRSALAMGVHGILFQKVRSAPLSGAVSKASAGAMEHMMFARVSNLVASLERFKKDGLWIVGTDARSTTPVDRADLNVAIVLVVGGEGKGIRPLVRRTCDLLVSVPQNNEVDSLNAAVAAAIVLYEATRQRRNN